MSNIFNQLQESLNWFKMSMRERNIALLLSSGSIAASVATYLAITQSENAFGPDPRNVIAFLLVNLICLLGLAAVITRRVVRLVNERKKGLTGSRLQTKIVVIFSLAAIIPTIIVSIFTVLIFNYGIQSWFNKRVSTAIEESVAVADGYLAEHRKIIKADILGITNDLNREATNIRKNPQTFNQVLDILASIRKLPEAIVFQKNNFGYTILAKTALSFSLEFTLEDLNQNTLDQIIDGDAILLDDQEDRVIALTKLDNFFETYLLVGRFVDHTIINHINLTKDAANEYNQSLRNISDTQIKFYIIFIFIALLLLLAVIWFAIIFATDLVNPVSELVTATEKVKEGDFSTRVKEGHHEDEITTLAKAFNQMTTQLEKQRRALTYAERRAAWSDVARRIAHEIKNPLTPIYLAADRLKRKYSKQIDDQETYNKYLDTITRHIGDIGTIVEEFVNFARMPAPIFTEKELNTIIINSLFSRQCASPDITFTSSIPDEKIIMSADELQLTQLFENLFKNAEESIRERMEKDNATKTGGHIMIKVTHDKSNCLIEISDNGLGFHNTILEKVTEPYVTTKSKGSGLGLAIVQKIIDDHNGNLDIGNTDKGAIVSILFPIKKLSK